MAEKAFIGIDPGKSGAAVLLCEDHLEFWDWSCLDEALVKMDEWIMLHPVVLIALESVHAVSYASVNMDTGKVTRKSQKGTSNFEFGRNFGQWEGILSCCGIPWVLVTPQKWQGGLLPKKKSKSDKPGFKAAREIYPGSVDFLEYKTKHHNRADALLIAHWAKGAYGSV